MKVIDLLNKMANDKDYRPTVSFLGVTFTYNTIVGDYENDRDSNYGIFTNYVIENILNDEVGVIKEKKELEEKLDWEEIIDSVGKPVWDNKRKKWRVLDYYSREKNKFKVSFSDTSYTENFEEKDLYFKEIKESEEK